MTASLVREPGGGEGLSPVGTASTSLTASGAVSWAALVLAALSLACGSAAQSQLRGLQNDNQKLKSDLEPLAGAVNGARAFAADTASGNPNALYMQYSAADLENMARQLVPYRIPARDIDSGLTGEIVVEQVEQFSFSPGNLVRCRIHLRGNNVKYTGFVPSGYQAQVKQYQTALANGWISNIAIQLALSGNTVSARANATTVQFKGPADRSMESRVRQAMNDRALKGAVLVDVALPGWTPQHVFLTSTHALVGYRR